MKIKTVTYSKVFSLGNYENEKIGVELELSDGDDVQKAMQDARNFVEFNHSINGYVSELEKCNHVTDNPDDFFVEFNPSVNGCVSELDKCNHVIDNPDDFTGTQVKRASERKNEILEFLQSGRKLL